MYIILCKLCCTISDVNECVLGTDGCEQFCNNTVGSFYCYCDDGYVLNTDTITCSGTFIVSTFSS